WVWTRVQPSAPAITVDDRPMMPSVSGAESTNTVPAPNRWRPMMTSLITNIASASTLNVACRTPVVRALDRAGRAIRSTSPGIAATAAITIPPRLVQNAARYQNGSSVAAWTNSATTVDAY